MQSTEVIVNRRWKLPTALWPALLAMGLLAGTEATAQSAAVAEQPRELLNSERIEQQFGSYGIDVLESDAEIRVSNLYSLSGQQKICRTFAVVHYPTEVDPQFAAEHRAILDGGSIGAVFTARGWTVRKSHRHYGNVELSPKVSALMGGLAPTELALHLYLLEISNGDAVFDYATIVEIHHPDYLRLADLERIYGQIDDGQDRDWVRAMLQTATHKM